MQVQILSRDDDELHCGDVIDRSSHVVSVFQVNSALVDIVSETYEHKKTQARKEVRREGGEKKESDESLKF